VTARPEARRLPSFLFRSVGWSRSGLRVLDQTLLPGRVRYLRPKSAVEVAAIIKRLAVRGAPAIGVAAAYGMAAEARRLPDRRLRAGLEQAARVLIAARPTAVNLKWAVERIARSVPAQRVTPDAIRRTVLAEAKAIELAEVENSLALSRHGARLVPRNATILTICNTGALAAPGMGTALGVVFEAYLTGKKPRVYSCETRPLLQGARLTTLELQKAGIPVTLIADSAAASVIGRCDFVIAGADRIAANGDTANKVGTRMLALLAEDAGKPFYIAAPSSTFDLSCPDGAHIPVEERGADEVRGFHGCNAAPARTAVFNPAFDVTPAKRVTGFITEQGVLRPPYRRAIARLLKR
jgi:methylthioribose-1-phosphate isomerase